LCNKIPLKKLQTHPPTHSSVASVDHDHNVLNSKSSISSFGFYQNCRGLRTKLFNFKCNIVSFNYVFIVLTDTWLNDSFHNNELGMFNYNIYRCDRSSLTSNSSRGGSIIIAIRKDFQSFLLPSPNLSLEQLFVSFIFDFKTYIIGAVYLPPSSSPSIYENYSKSIDLIIDNFPHSTYIIFGDFNLPEITWSNDIHGLSYSSTTNIRHPCIPEHLHFTVFIKLTLF